MLKAYIDDSNLSQGATAVLGGWIASKEALTSLSDEWQDILQMKPKIGYFKYSEAYSLTGEFSGFSQQSRDEKVKFLVAALARHNPLAVVSAIPHDLHKEVFGQ